MRGLGAITPYAPWRMAGTLPTGVFGAFIAAAPQSESVGEGGNGTQLVASFQDGQTVVSYGALRDAVRFGMPIALGLGLALGALAMHLSMRKRGR